MKTISGPLQAFLLAPPSELGRSDLIDILLANGTALRVNFGGNQDLTYPDAGFNGTTYAAGGPVTYYTSRFGAWERGAFKNKAEHSPTPETMQLTALVPESVLYPGTSTPLMQAINAGTLNGAVVAIRTIFWDASGPYTAGLSMGYMVLTVGQVGNIKNTGRSKITCDVFDLTYILNRPFPPHQIQSACRHSLFDAGCTLVAATFTSAAVALTSGSSTLYLKIASGASPYPLPLGYVIFITGQNAGLKASIKAVSTSGGTQTLQLAKPLPFPVSTGDTIKLVPGCDKTIPTCQGTFNNIIHFGGMPLVPNPEVAS